MSKKDEALKLALEALQKIYIAPEHEEYIRVWWPACEKAITALREALAEQPAQQQPVACECHRCIDEKGLNVNGLPLSMTKMILCPKCGNKRCPKASDHRLVCTNSNDPEQPGSIYKSPPAQRTWVGLTDEERQSCTQSPFTADNYRAIEAKLKEKNTHENRN